MSIFRDSKAVGVSIFRDSKGIGGFYIYGFNKCMRKGMHCCASTMIVNKCCQNMLVQTKYIICMFLRHVWTVLKFCACESDLYIAH